jgi:hypothetical protein
VLIWKNRFFADRHGVFSPASFFVPRLNRFTVPTTVGQDKTPRIGDGTVHVRLGGPMNGQASMALPENRLSKKGRVSNNSFTYKLVCWASSSISFQVRQVGPA